MKEGSVVKISGPTVVARDLEGASLYEVVRVGGERLVGEVIRIRGGLATIQVYEETTGLGLGEPVIATGEPLVVELGPGLLGQTFDGIQRPLSALALLSGDFIRRGIAHPALDREKRWDFEPLVRVGDEIDEGRILGAIQETAHLTHRVLAPPGVSGKVVEVKGGKVTVTDDVIVLDDGRRLSPLQRWPVRRRRPFKRRLTPALPFLTGQRVLDCFFPIAVGGAAIIPGGFGTGKTVLEQTLAKFAAADVIVYVGCGERGNEMTEVLTEFPRLVDPRTGTPLMDRTVLVVNTSNMPVAAREASIYTGITIAEYFRDMGHQVALMADSTSRWAEALREISSRLEEMPGEEGFPTYLATRLGTFYERAGRVIPLSGEGEGAVTIVGAVSPPGGDFSEPVTQASLRVSGAFWALSTDLAYRRHFPAIDWVQSFTLYAERLQDWFNEEVGEEWIALREEAMRLLQKERELQEIVQLVGLDAVQDQERVLIESARLIREGFLRQSAFHEVDASCPPAKALWMLRLILHYSQRAALALGDGVSLKAVLAAGLDERLLRLGEVSPGEIEAVGAALMTEIDETLKALART
ncbi:MAG: Sodium-transporting two-sector ATPase [Deltaproteobacteria bacterium]|nr:Sodium-transporting two-sector ATPase [Deltaproteobacteria bacterium]